MSLLILIAGVVFLLTTLAILREQLLFELASTSLLLFRNHKIGVLAYSFLMLPGTIIHELSHFVVAELLRVPTGKLSVLPDSSKHGGERNLGSLQTAKTDPIRASLIGLAPLISGLAILVILSLLIRDWWNIKPLWQVGILIYAVVVTSNSMFTSDSDRASLPPAVAILLVLGAILYAFGLRIPGSFIDYLRSVLEMLLGGLGLTVALNLGTIGVSSLVRVIIEKLSHKKIIRAKGDIL